MSRWFRFYDTALDDPKVQRLEPALFKAWVNILCIASRNDGRLPPMEDLAFMLRMSVNDTSDAMRSLKSAGLIDDGEDGPGPHNWRQRQFQSDNSTDRVKRYRNGKRNVSSPVSETVSETPPDTDTDTDTEAETEKSKSDARARALFPNFYDPFFKDGTASRPKAEAIWITLSENDQIAAISAVPGHNAYCAKHPSYTPISPANFLKERRFENYVAKSPAIPIATEKIYPDTPEWDAWLSFKRSCGQRTEFMEAQGRAGAGFPVPSRFPPRAEAA